MSAYVVYSFNVCGSEPGDAMEDLSFVEMKQVFSSLDRAKSYASRYVDKVKQEENVRHETDDEEFVDVYYLSTEELPDGDIEFDNFHGQVVVVRKVDLDNDDLSEDDDTD